MLFWRESLYFLAGLGVRPPKKEVGAENLKKSEERIWSYLLDEKVPMGSQQAPHLAFKILPSALR